MKNAEKIVGLIFAALTALNLLRGDWLGTALTGMASVSMLFGERLKLPPLVEGVLAVVAIILIIARVAQMLA